MMVCHVEGIAGHGDDCRVAGEELVRDETCCAKRLVLLGRKKALPLFGLTQTCTKVFCESNVPGSTCSHREVIVGVNEEDEMYVKFSNNVEAEQRGSYLDVEGIKWALGCMKELFSDFDVEAKYIRKANVEVVPWSRKRLSNRWLSMKKDVASCDSKYLAYSRVEVEYQGSSRLLLQPELPE
ncbi:hypothetical protein Tco_0178358 [Tanacetum coccineum]